MKTKFTRVTTALFAVVMLFTCLIPLTAFASEVTMDLSDVEVSWNYTLTDEEGNPFDAY